MGDNLGSASRNAYCKFEQKLLKCNSFFLPIILSNLNVYFQAKVVTSKTTVCTNIGNVCLIIYKVMFLSIRFKFV